MILSFPQSLLGLALQVDRDTAVFNAVSVAIEAFEIRVHRTVVVHAVFVIVHVAGDAAFGVR